MKMKVHFAKLLNKPKNINSDASLDLDKFEKLLIGDEY